MMRKIAISALVAVAAVLGSVVPAVTASAATTGTMATAGTAAMAGPAVATRLAAVARPATPARSATVISADLGAMGDKISCASPTACLAVGGNGGDTGPELAVAYALHGTTWRSVAVKAPTGAQDTALTAVSCKAATYCLVIGGYDDKAGTLHPAAWTWNGTALTPAAAPPLAKADSLESLAAVSCVAVKSCVAVGSAYAGTSSVQLIWTWNGAKWALKTAAMPGAKTAELTAAHCFSLTSCVVGGSVPSGTSFTSSVLLATWSGKAFTPQQSPKLANAGFAITTGLSCFAPGLCAAVGENANFTTASGTVAGFAGIWNGKTWTVTNWAGPKGSTVSALFGVSCTKRTSCVAAGIGGTDKYGSAASLVWDGTHWSVVGVPGVGKGLSSEFEDVSCPKTGVCVAIGQYGNPAANTSKPLAGYWNGKAWKLKAA
jgi:hypothetical protein